MEKLNLTKVKAYTLDLPHSSQMLSSKKVYKSFEAASLKAAKSSVFDPKLEVTTLENIYETEVGQLYQVYHVGQFTDVIETLKAEMAAKIRQKLTVEELLFLGIV